MSWRSSEPTGATAELWAGTTVSTGANQSVGRIPLDAANTRMTVEVYSPAAGVPVRLKLEDAADNTHTVETEATTTATNAWETLTFNFANQAPGTAALNPAFTYNKVSIFFNFGTPGSVTGVRTYYFDDVTFVTGALADDVSKIYVERYFPPRKGWTHAARLQPSSVLSGALNQRAPHSVRQLTGFF